MNTRREQILFWGCFLALLTTSVSFFSRMYLCGSRFITDFGLDKVAVGELQGAGAWTAGVSTILFGLFIDRIGVKAAMIFSFLCYLVYVGLAFGAYAVIQGLRGAELVAAQALGFKLLYWGSFTLGLGCGSVEGFVNPVVASLFKDKTRWLNVLHAGWPAGLVLGGMCTIGLADSAATGDWRLVLGLVLAPAVIYFAMLIGITFPKSERVQAGVSYLDMLRELGAIGALIGFGLLFAELGRSFGWPAAVVWGLTAVVVIGFAVLTRSLGRPLLIVLLLLMVPLATTEIGTDGWISSLMEQPMKAAGHNAGWVLVYTSAIMMGLRFLAGPIVKKLNLSPLGLLAVCSVLAIAGLTALANTNGATLGIIFAAAALYAFGKTFFWPTMLGIVAEQCPRGGALTINTISGIGMLAVGILGFPFIGYLQESSATQRLQITSPAVYQSVKVEKTYLLGNYEAIDPAKAAALQPGTARAAVQSATTAGQFAALGKMALFPAFMLCVFVGLILYFKSKGGYRPVELVARPDSGASS